jgi:fibronectin type 3 domain-containing protein
VVRDTPGAAGAARAARARRPTGLVALSGEPRQVPLWWQPVLRGAVTGYRVYRRDPDRSAADPAAFLEVGRVRGPVSTSFVDRGGALDGEPGRLGDGRPYTYVVAAEGSGSIGERSDPVTAATAPPPAPPPGLAPAPPRAGAILLTWEPSRDERVAGYRVYRGAFAAGPFEPVGSVGGRFATAFADPASHRLIRLRTYYYRIAATSVVGSEGPPSEPVPAWLKPRPLPPLDLVAVGGLARHVRLRWAAGHEHDLRAFVVWRAVGDGPFTRLATLPAGRTDYADGGLADGVTYRYRLTAVDTDRLRSEPSTIVAATTRARPAPPLAVAAIRERGGVEVRWRPAPPTAGVARYRLVRVGVLGRLTPVAEVTGNAARDPGAAGGRYAVVAIDVEGLESLPSLPVEARGTPGPPAPASPTAAVR